MVRSSPRGSGTPDAVKLAIRLAAQGVRALGFHGSTPHLQRELPNGTINLVNFQRTNAGVTGREPSVTVNLNVVTQAMRDHWAATGDWRSKRPLRSGVDIGTHQRLGHVAFGRDYWWNPSDAEAARATADEVVDLMVRYGIPWLDEKSRDAQ